MRGTGNAEVSGVTTATTVARTEPIGSTPHSELLGQDKEAMPHAHDVDSNTDSSLTSSLGYLDINLDKGRSKYIGQEHWHTVLSEISEVKAYFANHKEIDNSRERVSMSTPTSAREGLTLLLGVVPPATDVELRAELPPMSTVLTLCSRYFNSPDNLVVIVHPPTFHQQLQRHWEDPSKTPIMWLGLLYSILCLGMLSYHKLGDEPSQWEGQTLRMAGEYRLRIVQCLITGDYTKPVENTVETMLLYVFGEYSWRFDVDLGLWLIVSLTTKIAFHMGYHRDAKWFTSLTPFQGEMRRRTWALLRMADVMFAHQVSLPHTIYSHHCDTQAPTNLLDEDFGPESPTLPPSRPNNELTPIAYSIAKVKLCQEMSDILETINRVGGQIQYEEILRFDTRLRGIFQTFPPHLKVVPLEGCRDSITVVMMRFSINALYLKIICLLHKKYVPRARENPQYAYSRRSAVTAASDTLRNLINLHQKSNDTDGPRSLEWFVNSMATKEFLVCAMLVALDLHYDCMAEVSNDEKVRETALFWTSEQRMEMLSNLEMTKDLWKGLADSSIEALQASKVLEIMLEKIKSPASTPETAEETRSAENSHLSGVNTCPTEPPDHSSAMMQSPLPMGMMASTEANHAAQTSGALDNMYFSSNLPGSNMIPNLTEAHEDLNMMGSSLQMFPNLMADEFAENFDWNTFENYAHANWGGSNTF
ncbi:Transcription factor, fungi [Penicillium expansum]|uniref:Transcription factor, fungi n=1 Tax=Penicillium expansum TaxID=27334 RepID=A0A0A2KX50_PENEN|nr:Transcription factor, fungi [Penicillium expansum]KGO36826.1 Transcription factor, fungi [Penicillium expansum]KGO60854.1 Transcription factor, fungi [Penicillium expansum]KGO72402.1 Transcription factor, fungi [Penicillium expansum]